LHPIVQRIKQWLGPGRRSGFLLALDVVDLGQLLQHEPGDLAVVRRMQVKKIAPGSRPQSRHW